MADPIMEKFRAKMNAIAEVLDETFNDGRAPNQPKVVFTLLIAESGKMEGGRVNYISNGHREDMISMLKEWLGRVEGRTIDPPEGTPQ